MAILLLFLFSVFKYEVIFSISAGIGILIYCLKILAFYAFIEYSFKFLGSKINSSLINYIRQCN